MLKLIVTHGLEKYKILFDTTQPTSAELSEKLEILTGILSTKQKLIHKGKKLEICDKFLSDFGVCSGSKLMLLGCKVNPDEEELIKKIEKVKSDAEKIKEDVNEQSKQLAGIKEGYIPDSMKTEALSQTHKQCIGSVEKLMKLLEQLDSIKSSEDSIRKLKRNQVVFVQVCMT